MKISALVPTLMLGATLLLPASALANDTNSDAETWTKNCKVTEVAALFGRVHVRCVGPSHYGDIYYFAAPTSASAEAARLLALGTAAMMDGANLWIRYNWNYLDAASYGCAVHDCRRALELRLIK